MSFDPNWISSMAAVGAAVSTAIYMNRQNRTNQMIADKQAKLNREIALIGTSANIVSTNRQKWINEVRDTVAGFQSATNQIRHLSSAKGNRQSHENEERDEDKAYEEALLMRHRLALLINPEEEEHKKLVALVDQRISLLPCKFDEELRREETIVTHHITTAAQTILKKEWERVKKGEPITIM